MIILKNTIKSNIHPLSSVGNSEFYIPNSTFIFFACPAKPKAKTGPILFPLSATQFAI